jgi:large subunit ribosomal protein L17
MRHGVKLNRLSRTSAHRKALMKNMAISLITHKRIITTAAKAKALRVYIEPMLTKSKADTTHNRRLVFAKLQNKEAIKELFSTVNAAIADRPGGYTRIIKMAPRVGDAAEMAMIELVDFNTVYTGKPATEEKKKTRRSRSGSTTTATSGAAAKKAAPTAAPAPEASNETANEVVTEEVVVNTPVVEETVEVIETPAVAEELSTPAVEEVAPVEAVAEETAATEQSSAPATEGGDELEIVEGIGPKIADLFRAKGINTFAALAATSVEDMKAILDEAGPAFMGKDPGTWAQQAQMAADGKMDELKAWQDELNGGK